MAHTGVDRKQKISHGEINATSVAGSVWQSSGMTARLHLNAKSKLA